MLHEQFSQRSSTQAAYTTWTLFGSRHFSRMWHFHAPVYSVYTSTHSNCEGLDSVMSLEWPCKLPAVICWFRTECEWRRNVHWDMFRMEIDSLIQNVTLELFNSSLNQPQLLFSLAIRYIHFIYSPFSPFLSLPMSKRFATFLRHKVCLENIYWMRGQRQRGSFAKSPTHLMQHGD